MRTNRCTIVACLLRARELGEIKGGDTELREHARLILNSLQGILVQLRLADDSQKVLPAVTAIGNYVRRLSSR